MEPSALAIQLAYHIRTARLGRRRLASRTGNSEMVVRLELDRMRDEHLIAMERSGAMLTAAGERVFAPILDIVRAVRPVVLNELRIDAVELAAHIKAQSAPVAWAVRDRAIRQGATGCLVLVYESGEWTFSHNREPVRRNNPTDADALADMFPDPGDGALLLIVAAPSLGVAALGLWEVVRFLQVSHE
jgi:hypothetical protein